MPVLYIDVDSLRPDHVGAYGYELPTTPNIDELAADAVRFERAYAANSPCMPSRAAASTGRYGLNNGVETHGRRGQTLNEPGTTRLPELFFEERVPTAAVSSFPRHPATWFYHLWHEFRQPQEPEGEGFQAPRGETVTDHAAEMLRDRADDDFFLYAQYWDPHGRYNRSDAEIEPFRGSLQHPYPTAEAIEAHREWDAWRSASRTGVEHGMRHVEPDTIEDRSALEELVAHYDAEIRYLDEQVGRLLEVLRSTGRYDDTLIVLTADHGEEFGEHGVYREHWSTHDGTQRVPLLIKPPEGERAPTGPREQLVTNVDLAPTIADYAGLEAPAAWQGRSLRPALEDPDAAWRDRIVVDHGLYTAQRAVRTDRWKFIRTYHPGMWGGVVPDRQLFDMTEDPWEQENLSEERPEVVEELEASMLEWVEAHRGDEEDELRAVARTGPAGSAGRLDEFEGV